MRGVRLPSIFLATRSALISIQLYVNVHVGKCQWSMEILEIFLKFLLTLTSVWCTLYVYKEKVHYG